MKPTCKQALADALAALEDAEYPRQATTARDSRMTDREPRLAEWVKSVLGASPELRELLVRRIDENRVMIRFPGGDGKDRALIECYTVDLDYARALASALLHAVDKEP